MIEFLWNTLPKAISEDDVITVGEQGAVLAIILFFMLIVFLFYILLFKLSIKINKAVFKKIRAKNGNSITYQFLEKVIMLVIFIVMIVLPLGGDKLGKSLLGSTAVVTAVVGLAANDVIRDMFAGLQISLYKPFDVGHRIMLQDGRTGIVEKMTLRHMVIALIDTTRLIVPNRTVNDMIITNYSYVDNIPRALDIRIPIGYDSDIEEAKRLIRETICECPLTLNKDKYKEDDPSSRSVYFLEMAGSALIMGATVYYPFNIRTEVVKDEINTRIFNALKENNVEIPHEYLNVYLKSPEAKG